jgi:hypothetical protein
MPDGNNWNRKWLQKRTLRIGAWNVQGLATKYVFKELAISFSERQFNYSGNKSQKLFKYISEVGIPVSTRYWKWTLT